MTEQKNEEWIALEADFSGKVGDKEYKLVTISFYVPKSKATDENKERLNDSFQKFLEEYMDVVNSDKIKQALEKATNKE